MPQRKSNANQKPIEFPDDAENWTWKERMAVLNAITPQRVAMKSCRWSYARALLKAVHCAIKDGAKECEKGREWLQKKSLEFCQVEMNNYQFAEARKAATELGVLVVKVRCMGEKRGRKTDVLSINWPRLASIDVPADRQATIEALLPEDLTINAELATLAQALLQTINLHDRGCGWSTALDDLADQVKQSTSVAVSGTEIDDAISSLISRGILDCVNLKGRSQSNQKVKFVVDWRELSNVVADRISCADRPRPESGFSGPESENLRPRSDFFRPESENQTFNKEDNLSSPFTHQPSSWDGEERKIISGFRDSGNSSSVPDTDSDKQWLQAEVELSDCIDQAAAAIAGARNSGKCDPAAVLATIEAWRQWQTQLSDSKKSKAPGVLFNRVRDGCAQDPNLGWPYVEPGDERPRPRERTKAEVASREASLKWGRMRPEEQRAALERFCSLHPELSGLCRRDLVRALMLAMSRELMADCAPSLPLARSVAGANA